MLTAIFNCFVTIMKECAIALLGELYYIGSAFAMLGGI